MAPRTWRWSPPPSSASAEAPAADPIAGLLLHRRGRRARRLTMAPRLLGAILLALSAVASGASADEAYPARPVTIVNPFPPGGIADLTARPLAPALERLLKQPGVVANKAGAAGALGVGSGAGAQP